MQYLFNTLTFGGLTATFLATLTMWDDPSILNLLLAQGSLTLTAWSSITADHIKCVRKPSNTLLLQSSTDSKP